MVKDVFRPLLTQMQETARARDISPVDMTPPMFQDVVQKKYIYKISDSALQAAVAKAESRKRVTSRISVGQPAQKKRRLSEMHV